MSNQCWIFGGVVRGDSTQCFVEFVPNRSREVLVEVISRQVAPSSTIVSDLWRGYTNLPLYLPTYNIEHLTINHSTNFVNPNNEMAHTQTIKGLWSILKRKLRIKGTNHGKKIGYYIAEILYRRKYGENDDNLFNNFIQDLINYT